MFTIINAEIINLSPLSPLDENSFMEELRELYRFFKVDIKETHLIEPTPKEFVETLAKALEKNDIVITIGGIGEHLEDMVKTTVLKGFGLETVEEPTIKNYIKDNYPVKFDKTGDILYTFPTDATVFPPRFSYTYGFGICSKDQCIIALPNHVSDCKDMLFGDVAAFIAEFAGGDLHIHHTEYKLSKTSAVKTAVKEHSVENGIILYTKIQDICKVVIAGESNIFSSLCENCEKTINFTPKERTSKNKKSTKKKTNLTQYKVLISIFILIFITCLIYIGYIYWQSENDDKLFAMANSNSSSVLETEESDIEEYVPQEPQIIPKLQSIFDANSDTIGWLTIAGTNIDYPVMQYIDNDYYKTNDINHTDNSNGAIFVDYTTDFDTPSKNIVIYGKNPKDDTMLADITGYKSVDFYKEHPTLTFSTLYEENIYKISGVMVVNGNPDQGEVYDFTSGINPVSPKEIGALGAMIKECTFIHTDLDITEDDEILTLYTDSYEFMGAKTVVVARKLRQGENTAVNTAVAKKNEEPLMPDIWYKAYGGYKPGEEPPPSSKPATPSSLAPVSSSTSPTPPLPSSSTPPVTSSSKATSDTSITKISAHPNSIELGIGDVIDISIDFTPKNPSDTTITCKSNKPDIIGILEGDGFIELEGLEEGTTTLTITAVNGIKTTAKVVVTSEKSSSSKPNNSSDSTPPSTDVLNETLYVKSGGKTVKSDAYTIVSQIVENETRGNFHQEALKAHVVATYSYVKYNNARGLYPSVILRTPVSSNVKKATNAVLGEAVYYNGQIINAPYYSTGNGYTTTSQSVWGTSLPYLVSVESPHDDLSPYFKGTFSISKDDFADKVLYTYGIDLYDYGEPSDWVEITSYNPGDYVNKASLGGSAKSLGGEVSKGTFITGRNIREQLLDYSIRSTSFEVKYSGGKFIFTTYGYGHGVGMSQWGAQGMALDGYSYDEILTHYYTDTTVK